ncbi:redoxin family protein [uncultured Chitinophaga sp.]|jgi:Peroxiredoxin|uniref:redoxin family protein n=1 Tax=uncultured Chitinophaga sp. TaxID=339340 RepID=UPI002624EF52|nr:redoxin family protein [uncultured Chitinophaga sp.]
MKSTFGVLITVILITFILFSAFRSDTLDIGDPIPKPDIQLHDISGRNVSLNAAKGANGLLVMFTGNRCPYVLRNQSRTAEICAFALQHQVGVIMVNSNTTLHNGDESLEAMKAYAAEQQYRWYYVIDKKAEIAEAFDASHTPECYLFDKNGRLSYKGAIDDNPGNADAVKTRHLHNAINEMLAGGPVKTNSTSALGCNIKRY